MLTHVRQDIVLGLFFILVVVLVLVILLPPTHHTSLRPGPQAALNTTYTLAGKMPRSMSIHTNVSQSQSLDGQELYICCDIEATLQVLKRR